MSIFGLRKSVIGTSGIIYLPSNTIVVTDRTVGKTTSYKLFKVNRNRKVFLTPPEVLIIESDKLTPIDKDSNLYKQYVHNFPKGGVIDFFDPLR